MGFLAGAPKCRTRMACHTMGAAPPCRTSRQGHLVGNSCSCPRWCRSHPLKKQWKSKKGRSSQHLISILRASMQWNTQVVCNGWTHTCICAVHRERKRGVESSPAAVAAAFHAIAAGRKQASAWQAQCCQHPGPRVNAAAGARLGSIACWLEAEPHNRSSHVGDLKLPRGRLKPQRLLHAAPLEA